MGNSVVCGQNDNLRNSNICEFLTEKAEGIVAFSLFPFLV